MRFKVFERPVYRGLRRSGVLRAALSRGALHRFTRCRQVLRPDHAARALHAMRDAHARWRVLLFQRRLQVGEIGAGLGDEIPQDLRSVGGVCGNFIQLRKIDGRGVCVSRSLLPGADRAGCHQ